jgi:3-methyladenine DNA glycosylase/8-oxoguanine DNA glycosylase
LILKVPSHFSFTSTVESHGWYRLAPFQWSPEEGVLRRREANGDIEISFEGGALCVKGAVEKAHIARMFQLHVDTSEFIELAKSSPAHVWVVRENFGRLLCGATLWEDAVKIIATTNTMWRQTVRMVELLVAKCGNGAFPTQAQVARFSRRDAQALPSYYPMHDRVAGVLRDLLLETRRKRR